MPPISRTYSGQICLVRVRYGTVRWLSCGQVGEISDSSGVCAINTAALIYCCNIDLRSDALPLMQALHSVGQWVRHSSEPWHGTSTVIKATSRCLTLLAAVFCIVLGNFGAIGSIPKDDEHSNLQRLCQEASCHRAPYPLTCTGMARECSHAAWKTTWHHVCSTSPCSEHSKHSGCVLQSGWLPPAGWQLCALSRVL